MSAFIGPIHYWLYGKIRLVSQREAMIYNKVKSTCGAVAEELQEQVWQTYGAPLPDTDLSELIDHTNIHGWLQRQINLVESREAAFIKELLGVCGDTAKEQIGQAFSEHGRISGQAAKELGKYDLDNAPGIYKALNDFYLNGMPCDQADMLVLTETDRVVWESGVCLHEQNWKRAGISPKIMVKFYQLWLESFIKSVNADYAYKQLAARETGEAKDRFEISRNSM